MIVVDSDFLSSFLKINRLEMVRDFFKEDLHIPLAVQKEIARTDLILKLNEKKYVHVHHVKRKDIVGSENLGDGELECMSLAEGENDIILMNDRAAANIARLNKIKTVNIPGFLLSVKESAFANKLVLKSIVSELKEKDYCYFSKEDEENITL